MMSSDDANPPAPPATPAPPAQAVPPASSPPPGQPAPPAQAVPPGRPTRSTAQVLRAAIRRRNLGHGLFWSWNAIFILVTGFGILPYCLIDLWVEAGNGLLPWNLVASALLVVLIPPAATILGILFWRHEPERLFAFFYGVEAPLFLLALMRLFLIRELMPGLGLVLILMGVSSTVYVLAVLGGDEGGQGTAGTAGSAAGSFGGAARSVGGAIIRLVGGSVCLAVGLYAGGLLAFYAVPAGWALIEGFFGFEWLRSLWHALRYSGGLVVVYMLPAMVLFFYSATLFVMLPFVMVPLYVRCWWRLWRGAAARVGASVSWGVTATVLIGQVGLFVGANRQPQREALALVAEPPRSDAERRARLGEAEAIRAGLLNAYLAPYRYISTTESDPGASGNVRRLYRDTLHLGDAWGERVERLFAVVARPLLFEGQGQPAERAEAARRYAEFFDVPLQKGEKDRVLHALESTYNRDDREAGLLSEGERKVWVARQEVGVVEHGDWAEVELHEVYENRTPQQQELFYYFSLPETAAVVGLWLGESEDRSKAFVYTLAPRGAAQQVYRQEVQRRVDPCPARAGGAAAVSAARVSGAAAAGGAGFAAGGSAGAAGGGRGSGCICGCGTGRSRRGWARRARGRRGRRRPAGRCRRWPKSAMCIVTRRRCARCGGGRSCSNRRCGCLRGYRWRRRRRRGGIGCSSMRGWRWRWCLSERPSKARRCRGRASGMRWCSIGRAAWGPGPRR